MENTSVFLKSVDSVCVRRCKKPYLELGDPIGYCSNRCYKLDLPGQFEGELDKDSLDKERRKLQRVRKTRTEPKEKSLVSSGNKGAIYENVAVVDLMRKGYFVFRATGPHGPCDLMILKGITKLAIEVCMGTRCKSGELSYNRHSKYEHIFDIIAVVEESGLITYIPSLE